VDRDLSLLDHDSHEDGRRRAYRVANVDNKEFAGGFAGSVFEVNVTAD
jgi:hypothetical protein